jgi:hypothetical protein
VADDDNVYFLLKHVNTPEKKEKKKKEKRKSIAPDKRNWVTMAT